jgi:Ca2+-binding RTX toxin-like protein
MTLSTATFVGLSDLVYNDLPADNSLITLNGDVYQVLKSANTASGYQGMVLQSQTDSSVIVVNRGTEAARDVLVDGQMVFAAANSQWSDALQLAQYAQTYAQDHGNATVYATGHSLGGTLAQLQAADFGWQGVTFNAYGAYQLSQGPSIHIAISSNASITNYRTTFDLVSDVSTHIGSLPITLVTQTDASILASQEYATQSNGISIIAGDHGISNFFESTPYVNPDHDGLPHVYELNLAFGLPSASPQQIAHAENILNGLAAFAAIAVWDDTPGTDLSSSRIRAELVQWLTNNDVGSIQAIEPTNPDLLAGALYDSPFYNNYRAALVALSPVALANLPSELDQFKLWKPGQTTGYTAEYLTARANMVAAGVALAASGLGEGTLLPTTSQDTFIYSDFSRSLSPLYTLQGNGTKTHVVSFASDSGTGLTVQPGADGQLYGGIGNDTLFGGNGNDTLQGGAGLDDYRINGSGTGVDSVLDTDANGLLEWIVDGVTHVVTGGADVAGTSSWVSADGLFTFDEDLASDGTTELEITHGSKLVTVDNFTNGNLGITLGAVGTPASGPSNLAGLHSIAYDNFTQYQDLSGAPRDHLDTIYGSNTTGGPYSLIEGFGNAGLIVAGDGDNEVFADRSDEKAATSGFVTPISITMDGGQGNQLLVGLGNGHETIVGGQSSGASAWDTIDGAGASGLLSGGAQNAFILAGTGSVSVTAASATSPNATSPFTVALGGLSFWGDQVFRGDGFVQVSGEPAFSIAAFTDPANFQISLQLAQLDGSYAAPFGLLGSTRNPASVQASTVPGQSFSGGNGTDYLIGNSGADTIKGGTPNAPQSGIIDSVMVGGAGSDLIYGGSGTEVIFADMSAAGSATWADDDATHADTIYGGSGNAYIYGSGGATQFYGGAGNYTIHTGNGNAYVATGFGTALVYAGTGNDTIVAEGTLHEIHLGAGHSVVDADSGQSTVIAGTGDQVINSSSRGVQIIEGTGATTLNVTGSTGSEYVVSHGGSTLIEFASGITESDVVVRNQTGDLVLTDHGFDSQVDVAGYFGNGADVSLHFSDGTTWTRDDLVAAAIRPSTDWSKDTLVGSTGDDSIVAGYGTTLIDGGGGNNTLVGSLGNDTLQGGSGSDTMIAGSGTTYFQGGSGAEHYTFSRGNGFVEITENHQVQGTDTLTFGVGITASDVSFDLSQYIPNGLNIFVDGAAEPNVIVDDFIGPNATGHQVGVFAFSDGTQLTRAQLLDRLEHVNGTTGHDTLRGSSLDDVLDGKGGGDSIIGSGGSDTFVFNPGYGSLEVNEDYDAPASPVLQIGGGITASSLHASVSLPPRPNNYGSSGDLILTDGISGDRIQLDGMYGYTGASNLFQGVAQVRFDDGSSMTLSQLYALASRTTGTAGSDTLAGTKGAELIDGKGGDDYAVGNDGADTFVFNSNYNSLEINETLTDTGTISVLRLGAGILASNLTAAFSQSSTTGDNGLVLETGSGHFIFIDNYDTYTYANGPIRRFELASGEILTDIMVRRMAQTHETAAQVISEQGGTAIPSSAPTPAIAAQPSVVDQPQASSVSPETSTIGAGHVSIQNVSMHGGSGSTTVVPWVSSADASPVAASHGPTTASHRLVNAPNAASTASDAAHMQEGLRGSRLSHLQAPADAGEPRRKPGQPGDDTGSGKELASVVDDQDVLRRNHRAADDSASEGIVGAKNPTKRGTGWAATQAATSAADDMLRSLGFSNGSGLADALNGPIGERPLYLQDGGEWYRSDNDIALGHVFGTQDQGQQGAELSERTHARLIQAMAGMGGGTLSTAMTPMSNSEELAISLATSAS